jgi:hypothetical protein
MCRGVGLRLTNENAAGNSRFARNMDVDVAALIRMCGNDALAQRSPAARREMKLLRPQEQIDWRAL